MTCRTPSVSAWLRAHRPVPQDGGSRKLLLPGLLAPTPTPVPAGLPATVGGAVAVPVVIVDPVKGVTFAAMAAATATSAVSTVLQVGTRSACKLTSMHHASTSGRCAKMPCAFRDHAQGELRAEK